MKLKDRALPTWVFIGTFIVLAIMAYRYRYDSSEMDRAPANLTGTLENHKGEYPQGMGKD